MTLNILEIHTDIPVGSVPSAPELGSGSRVDRMLQRLYPRRIDVAVLTPNGWVIIEAKPRANSSAVGQLLGYVYLWFRDCPTCPFADSLIVTDVGDVEARELAAVLGVGFVELGL